MEQPQSSTVNDVFSDTEIDGEDIEMSEHNIITEEIAGEQYTPISSATIVREQLMSQFDQYEDQVHQEPKRSTKFSTEKLLFLALFVIIFSSYYLTQESTRLLIEFLNHFLALSLDSISFQLPKTKSTIEAWMGYDKSIKSMRKYVMCTVCHSLYAESPLSVIPNECTKMRSRRTKCKNPLFHPSTKSNKPGRPFKTFAYCSIIESLGEMFMRKGFEDQLYGSDGASPNFHFLLHTYDNIFDMGPIYAYWLFPFERYNKLVKNINVNGKDSFEVTMLKTFLKRKNAGPFVDMMTDVDINEVYLTEQHAEFLKSIAGYTRELGTRAHRVSQKTMVDFYELSSKEYKYEVTGAEFIPLYERMEGKKVFINSDHYQLLFDYYKEVAYKDSFSELNFSTCPTIRIRNKLEIGGDLYTSMRSATPSGSFISAYFVQSNHANRALFHGVIEYFFEHYPTIDGVETRHVFAFTRWFKNLGNNHQPYIDSGLEFWDEDFEELDPLAILPVQKIYSYDGAVKYVTDMERNRQRSRPKMLIFPTLKKLHL
ncbi:hypothetical protein K501DRAFT_280722 [Backusella circina FSU 941]|nr:hypothetical protein K501DRAFT_280722 [Backusella circina FSU 941]